MRLITRDYLYMSYKLNRVTIKCFMFFKFETPKKRGLTRNHFCMCGPTYPCPQAPISSALYWNFWRDIIAAVWRLSSWWTSDSIFYLISRPTGPHKCFSHCPLHSTKKILPLVSTISSILLMLYEWCPPICAFQCSHLWPLQERMPSSKSQKFNPA